MSIRSLLSVLCPLLSVLCPLISHATPPDLRWDVETSTLSAPTIEIRRGETVTLTPRFLDHGAILPLTNSETCVLQYRSTDMSNGLYYAATGAVHNATNGQARVTWSGANCPTATNLQADFVVLAAGVTNLRAYINIRLQNSVFGNATTSTNPAIWRSLDWSLITNLNPGSAPFPLDSELASATAALSNYVAAVSLLGTNAWQAGDLAGSQNVAAATAALSNYVAAVSLLNTNAWQAGDLAGSQNVASATAALSNYVAAVSLLGTNAWQAGDLAGSQNVASATAALSNYVAAVSLLGTNAWQAGDLAGSQNVASATAALSNYVVVATQTIAGASVSGGVGSATKAGSASNLLDTVTGMSISSTAAELIIDIPMTELVTKRISINANGVRFITGGPSLGWEYWFTDGAFYKWYGTTSRYGVSVMDGTTGTFYTHKTQMGVNSAFTSLDTLNSKAYLPIVGDFASWSIPVIDWGQQKLNEYYNAGSEEDPAYASRAVMDWCGRWFSNNWTFVDSLTVLGGGNIVTNNSSPTFGTLGFSTVDANGTNAIQAAQNPASLPAGTMVSTNTGSPGQAFVFGSGDVSGVVTGGFQTLPGTGDLKKDGSVPMEAPFNNGGQLSTNLADGTIASDAAALGQVWSGDLAGSQNVAAATAALSNYVAAVSLLGTNAWQAGDLAGSQNVASASAALSNYVAAVVSTNVAADSAKLGGFPAATYTTNGLNSWGFVDPAPTSAVQNIQWTPYFSATGTVRGVRSKLCKGSLIADVVRQNWTNACASYTTIYTGLVVGTVATNVPFTVSVDVGDLLGVVSTNVTSATNWWFSLEWTP